VRRPALVMVSPFWVRRIDAGAARPDHASSAVARGRAPVAAGGLRARAAMRSPAGGGSASRPPPRRPPGPRAVQDCHGRSRQGVQTAQATSTTCAVVDCAGSRDPALRDREAFDLHRWLRCARLTWRCKRREASRRRLKRHLGRSGVLPGPIRGDFSPLAPPTRPLRPLRTHLCPGRSTAARSWPCASGCVPARTASPPRAP
jgi:hypothetical protein